jgi:hypothetical protein
MPVLYDPQTGQPIEITDPDEAAHAVLGGKLGFLKDAKVAVTTPDGRRGTVPSVNIGSALSRGFKLAEDIGPGAEGDLGDAVHTAGAFAAGALRAGTGGISDVLLTEGAERPMKAKKFFRGLKEESPIATGAGELVGTGAGIASGIGLPGMAEKASAAATAKLGGRVLAKAAGMGLEGGIYGLGQVISEQHLAEKPTLTAEKLFAGTAASVLFGAGLSLFGSGLAAGGSAIMSKLGGKGMRDLLEEHANKLALRQYARPTELRQHGLSPEEIQKIGQYGHERGLFGLGAEATRDAAAAQSTKEGQVLGRVLTQLDKKGQKFDPTVFTARAQKELVDALEGNPALKGAQTQLAGMLDEFRRYGPGGDLQGKLTFSKAWELRSDLLKKTGYGEANSGIKQELHNLQGVFREEILRQAGVVGGSLSDMLQGASRRYRNAEVIEQLAAKAAERSLGHRITSMSDMLTGLGGIATMGPAGVGMGVLNHYGREMGGSIISNAMYKLANGQAIGKLGSGLKKLVDLGLEASPAFGGAFRAQLERATASGAADLLATHVGLAKSHPDYLATVGMPDETTEAANQYAVRSDQLASIEAAASAQDVAMDRALGRFFGQGRPAKVDRSRFDTKDYAKAFARLEELALNPQALMQAVNAGDLGNVAPNVAGALSATAGKAVNYLYAVAPKNPNRNPIPALDLKWQPSDLELSRWGRHVSTVQEPSRVLQAVETGTLTWEQVDTLRNVYPEMLAQLQQRMMERMTEYKKPLTVPQRTMVSRLFGAPVGGMGDAKKQALIQDMYAATMQPPKSEGASSSDGRQDVNVVDNYQTQSQRIEARG